MAAVRRAAPTLIEMAEKEAEAAAAAAAAPVAGASAVGRPAQERVGLQRVLESVNVEPRDWWEALAAAPAPCSRRHGLSALSEGAARPVPAHLLPLLEAPVRAALRAVHSCALPLPPAAESAARAAASVAEGESGSATGAAATAAATAGEGVFASLLSQLGAVQPIAGSLAGAAGGSDAGALPLAPHPPLAGGRPGPSAALVDSRQQPADGSNAGRRGSCVPCRVLLAGEGERGQEQAAGAVLKLLEGERGGHKATLLHVWACLVVRQRASFCMSTGTFLQPLRPQHLPLCNAPAVRPSTHPPIHPPALPCRLPHPHPEPTYCRGGGRRGRHRGVCGAGWGGPPACLARPAVRLLPATAGGLGAEPGVVHCWAGLGWDGGLFRAGAGRCVGGSAC